jgi:hypothetical protein
MLRYHTLWVLLDCTKAVGQAMMLGVDKVLVGLLLERRRYMEKRRRKRKKRNKKTVTNPPKDKSLSGEENRLPPRQRCLQPSEQSSRWLRRWEKGRGE